MPLILNDMILTSFTGHRILLFEDTNNIDIGYSGWFRIFDGQQYSGVTPIVSFTSSNSFYGKCMIDNVKYYYVPHPCNIMDRCPDPQA